MSEQNWLLRIGNGALDALALSYWQEYLDYPERCFDDLCALVSAPTSDGFWDALIARLRCAVEHLAGRGAFRPEWSCVHALVLAAKGAALETSLADAAEVDVPPMFTRALYANFRSVAHETFRERPVNARLSVPVAFVVGKEGDHGGRMCWLDLELIESEEGSGACACHPRELLVRRFSPIFLQSISDAWSAARHALGAQKTTNRCAARWSLRALAGGGRFEAGQAHDGDSLGAAACKGWGCLIEKKPANPRVLAIGRIVGHAPDRWELGDVNDAGVRAKVMAVNGVLKKGECAIDRVLVVGRANRLTAEQALEQIGRFAQARDAPGIEVIDLTESSVD